MTIDRETVIRFAEKAGLPIAWISETGVITWAQLGRFATLVLEHGRKPLTEDQVVDVWRYAPDDDNEIRAAIYLARSIEAAHGITNKESSDAE